MVALSWFMIVVGAGIVGLWTMLLATQRVPEIPAGDIAIWFHLAAELLLGAALVAAGVLMVVNGGATLVRVFGGAALGGMVYSTVNSSGYYARGGEWGAVVGFGVLTLAGLAAILLLATA